VARPMLMKMISLFRQFGPSEQPLAGPSWPEVLSNSDERQAAAHYWSEVTTAMRDGGKLKPANAHAVLRLVTAYLIFDRVSAVNMRGGQIDVQAWSIQQAASQIASQIESDLGLSPRRHDRLLEETATVMLETLVEALGNLVVTS
jgi:hypothetical protein